VNKVLEFYSIEELNQYLDTATATLRDCFGAPWLPASSALDNQKVRVAIVFMVLTGFDFVIVSKDKKTNKYIQDIQSNVENLKYYINSKGSNNNE
jgi:hypothetical protein